MKAIKFSNRTLVISAAIFLNLVFISSARSEVLYDQKSLYLAAEAGDSVAMYQIGSMYFFGQGVSKDPAEAVKWFRKSAEAGNSASMHNIGVMYRDGIGVDKNYAQAIQWLRKAAEAGVIDSMINLGVMYQNGQGISKSGAEAVKWYRKAAVMGNTSAMYNLFAIYFYGYDVIQNDTEAILWLRKAAEGNFPKAMFALGYMYFIGRGVPSDDTQTVYWYQKSANAGDAEGMVNLGWMYSAGRGIAQNNNEAVRWYKKSADAGNAQAMRRLGQAYLSGKGVSENFEEALSWLQKSGRKSDAGALYTLGTIYTNGEHLDEDTNEAARYFLLAYQARNSDAKFVSSGQTIRVRAKEALDRLMASGEITDPAVLREVQAFFKPAPQASWLETPSSTSNEETRFRVRLNDQGGGIGDVQFFVDGAIVDRSSRDFAAESSGNSLTERSFRVKLPAGRHQIMIRAYAAENLGNFSELKSEITSTWQKVRKPKLHIVAVGVDEYAERSLNLKYARADAEAVYGELFRQIGGLYEAGETRLLTGRTKTGKQQIIDAIKAVQRLSEFDDVFVFYAASHGKNYEVGGYHMLTGDVAGKAANAVRPASLSHYELRDLFSQVKSRKKFVLLDTCHSGQSIRADDLVGARGLKDDEQDIIETMKQRSGATILMASEMAQVAFEGYRGHGLFTYALLEALGSKEAGSKAPKQGSLLTTDEVMMHVETRVPQLAKEIFRAEQKTYASKAGTGFPLLRVGGGS